MIEKRLIEYITDNVAFTSVNEPSIEKRNALGNKWIEMSISSKYKRNNVYYATVKFFIYAPTIYECSLLSDKFAEALENIVNLENIQSSNVNDIREDNDIVKKRPRYSAEVDFCYFD